MLCCHLAFFLFECHLDLLKTSALYSGMQNFPSESQRLISEDLLDFEITSWRMVVLNCNWFLRVGILLLLVLRADERFTHLTLDWLIRLKSPSLHSYFKHLLHFFINRQLNDTKFEPKVLIFFTTLKHSWEHPESGVGVKRICCSKHAAFVYMPHWSSANVYYLYYHNNTSPYASWWNSKRHLHFSSACN